MKSDTAAELVKDVPVAVGVVATGTLTLTDMSVITAIGVGLTTIAYTLIRMVHALRKWYIEEKNLKELP